MNKIYFAIIGIFIFLFGAYLYITQATNIFRFYYNSTSANEPNLRTGSGFIVSSLIEPKKMDFVCYKYLNPSQGEHKRIHRLVGIPGDTIKIRKGILYNNGKNADSSLSLIHTYTINTEVAEKLKQEKSVQYIMSVTYGYPNFSDGYTNMYLTQEIAHKYDVINSKHILEKNEVDKFIHKVYKKGWNKDYFGPLLLDKDEYFVMGDNRDFSDDSRHIGVIKESQLVGKVIKF